MKQTLLTFLNGGVHPEEEKDLTSHLPVEVMPTPDEVEIPLSQHFGAPCQAIVKKKAVVTEGDMIGEVNKGLGAAIHASVTGQVKAIGFSPHPMKITTQSVTIETDHSAEVKQYSACDWQSLSHDELISRVKNGGIVGIGGAGFPTHVKLSPPAQAKIETLILNGAECEPYLTIDHRLMIENTKEIIEGAKIILTILGIKDCRIGIEANKPDAIEAMSKAAQEASSSSNFNIGVDALKVKYPQGSEKQLIESITKRKVPAFGLPMDVGVVVQNVGTAKAIFDAVALNKPLYEKLVTISGRAINRPANVSVKVGTKLKDIVDFLGGTKENLAKIVLGGPMMGFAIPNLDFPVTKTTSGVLFLTNDEIDTTPYSQCIRCGWCLEACPMGLSPNEVAIYVEAGRAEETGQFGVFECFECGSCAYVCPAKRPLVQFIRIAKMKAKR